MDTALATMRMPTVGITIDSFPLLDVVENVAPFTLNMPLQPGLNSVNVELIILESKFNSFLSASISAQYTYDSDLDEISFNRSRTAGKMGGIQILLYGASEVCVEVTEHLAMPSEDADFNENDSRTASVIKEIPAAISLLYQTVCDALIERGIRSVLFVEDAPIVKADQVHDYLLMLGHSIAKRAPDEPNQRRAYVQGVLDSIYIGTVTWSQKSYFANVIGSTKDPKPTGTTSWIGLWRAMCNGGHSTNKCSSLNWFSNGGLICSSDLVGGHVILGKTAVTMPKGSNIYIFPICKVHNGSDANYMKSLYNPVGMKLSYW